MRQIHVILLLALIATCLLVFRLSFSSTQWSFSGSAASIANSRYPVRETHGLKIVFSEKRQIYTVGGMPIIWTFWDFGPMPGFVKLCRQTYLCHNSGEVAVVLLNKTTFTGFFPGWKSLPKEIDYLTPNHYSDYVRCILLAEFGGYYVDIDAVAFRSMKPKFDDLQNRGVDTLGYSWLTDNDLMGMGALGPSKVGVPMYSEHVKLADQLLAKKSGQLAAHAQGKGPYPLPWGGMMRLIYVDMFKSYNWSDWSYHFEPGETEYGQIITVLGWDFFKTSNLSISTEQQPKLANITLKETEVLGGSYIDKKLKTASISDFLNHKSTLGNLLVSSLVLCEARRTGRPIQGYNLTVLEGDSVQITLKDEKRAEPLPVNFLELLRATGFIKSHG